MRQSTISRKTGETDIELTLNLDGTGESEISSGVGFLDHMLTLFARHGRFDLALSCQGDTRVLCNPDNPTGRAFSREEALALHDSAAELGGELLVDEAFADYCAECSVRGRVCRTLTVVGSLMKILCIPGARLGYVCASPENIARLLNRKHVYFVPFRQDDPVKKPNSLQADFSLLGETVEAALRGEQLQPILR